MTATDPASELGGALAGAEQVVLIWNGRVSQAAADILAHLAHSLDARVLITPAGNELGAHAAGLGTHSPSEVLEAVESGQIKAIVLLGADPVGDWTNGERWRGALARAQFVLQVTAFQNDSSGWATTIVPASESLEQEGTVTNLEGRVQRLRAAATPPPRRAGRLRLDGRAGRAARPGSPRRRGPGVHRAGPIANRIRRHVVVVSGRAGRAARASTGILHPGRAAAGRRRRCPPGHDAGRLPRADQRHRGRPQPRAALPKAGGNRDQPRRRRGDGRRHRRSDHGQLDSRTASGPAIASRRLRPGTVRMAQRVPYVGPATVAADPAEEPADA